MSTSVRKPTVFAAAALAALGIALVPALSAAAATPTATNGTATLSATHAALSSGTGSTTVTGSGPITVSVAGAGYSALSGGGVPVPVGVYVVYGPKESDFNTNSGWYYDAEWIQPGQISGGAFSTSISIAETYTANPFHEDDPIEVSCAYDEGLSYEDNVELDQYRCYIQTFTAHGLPLRASNTLGIEVKW